MEDEIAFEKKIIMEERQRKDYINSQGELGDLDQLIKRHAKPKPKKKSRANLAYD